MPGKVVELNLEYDMPTVDAAVKRLKNALTTYKGQGCKAVIIIHGYGSTGIGGGIKPAVRKCLEESSMRGIVRAYAWGEQWADRKRELMALCGSLGDYDRRISGNSGITVVILK
jgi:hypothetical protein